MSWIVDNIFWILLISGALTATMIYSAIAPAAALRSMFGETLDGPLAEIVVRNWGALIALVGLVMIYGAYHEEARAFAAALAVASKTIFIALVLSQGGRYLRTQAAGAVVFDTIVVALLALYLAHS